MTTAAAEGAEGADRTTMRSRLAFDRLAPSYDTLTSGEAFQLQRKKTQRLLARWVRSGFRVLEIGCGTGADTEFLALLGALPTWGYSRNWGYGPGGGIGLILVIVLILVLSGRL